MAAICSALAQHGLQPIQPATGVSAYFRHFSAETSTLISKCEVFIKEFQSAFKAVATCLHPTSMAHAMGNMANAAQFGLDQMPPVDTCVASLVVSPDEAVCPQVCCPSRACRYTNDNIVMAYIHSDWIGQIDNTIH